MISALVAAAPLLLLTRIHAGEKNKASLPNLALFPDASGLVQTYNTGGDIDLNGPFFQSLGTNGRSCVTCHQPMNAMSVSAASVQLRFDLSLGTDPIFRTVDGSNCDHNIDVSTFAGRAAAYSLLRTRGLLRIALNPPLDRDFQIVSISNPYGCNATDVVSMYRRPLPATNLRFLTTVMFDGRESSSQTGTTPIASGNYPQSLQDDLAHQALDATFGHAQGMEPGLSAAQQQQIMSFEMSLYSAQAIGFFVGNLDSHDANGGPKPLAQQPFYIGINDPVGLDPNNPVPLKFNTKIFDLFDNWTNSKDPEKRAVARGEELFNTRKFTITGVAGLNGTTFSNGVTGPASIVSTCGICHDTPNVGNHSVSAPLNIGVSDPPGGQNVLDTRYLPVMKICQLPSQMTCVETTDPGRAMISGKFADIGKFKGPILRGLAARAPYFHNGSARTLRDVVDFYDSRFHIGFSDREKSDLAAFLAAL